MVKNIIIVLLFLYLCPLAFAESEYQIAPIPEWVVDRKFEKPEAYPADSIKDGTYYLLVDIQENPKARIGEAYRKYAEMVVNQEGIRTVSQISINFDPSYQKLIVHSIKVYRNENIFDKLHIENISILQREKNLEAQLYDGRKTFNLILDDIQVGDIVEYSYSIRGQNPVFNGKYYDYMGLQWKVPVYRVYHRLLWPKNKDLYIKFHKATVDPVIKPIGEFNEYLISLDNVPALFPDSDLPDWYNPYSWGQVSELKTWQDVINWGKKLYQVPTEISPELRKKIREIDTLHKQPENKLIATLRFIQDEIRYLGIETGPNSHKPYKPSYVFQRRFGDCKDKSLLTMTMLHYMNIESYPAFVSTRRYSQVKEWHPSPLAFNHVLLRVGIRGKYYWIDPTRTYQRGSLDHLYQPDFGFALVLNQRYKELISMSTSRSELPIKEIKEQFDLRNGYKKPITFIVETTYRARLADYFRRKFAVDSRKELEKSYLNFYAAEYPKIKANAAVTVTDDHEKNEFVVKESYTIEDFWKYSEELSALKATFYPLEFYEYFEKPATKRRVMPLKIWHPTHSLLTTEVLLPEEWEIEPSSLHIEDEAISFKNTVNYQNKHLTITYEYHTKDNHLQSDKVADHLNNLDRINKELGYFIANHNVPWHNNFNWPVSLVAVLFLGIASFSAVKVYHYQPKAFRKPQDSGSYIPKIGGWLILAGVGISIQPFSLGWQIVSALDAYSLTTWKPLTTPGSENYHFLWQPLLYYELSANIFWLVFSILIAILFFQKRLLFPKIYVSYLFITFAVQLIDSVALLGIPSMAEDWTLEDTSDLVRYAIFVMVWSLYFTRSKRVENTFVVTRKMNQSHINHPPIS